MAVTDAPPRPAASPGRTEWPRGDGTRVQGLKPLSGEDWRSVPVSVVLPSFNEERGVGPQVDAIRTVLDTHGITHEIIVVDDGSSDGTAQAAVAHGARVLRHHKNRGYGASIKSGMQAALYDTIVISDADGTYPNEEIPNLLRHLTAADMVVGARIGKNVNIPLIRRPAKWFTRKLAEVIAGQTIPDLNSGLLAFRRECLRQYLPILSNRFSFTTTSTLALLADDYQVIYHPIDYHKRIGQSKITPRHAMDFTILILRISMMFQPLRIFLPVALTFLTLGAGKMIFDIVAIFRRNVEIDWNLLYYPVLSTSATLLLMAGFQFLFIGMLADALVRRIVQQNQSMALSHGTWVTESEGVPPVAGASAPTSRETSGAAVPGR